MLQNQHDLTGGTGNFVPLSEVLHGSAPLPRSLSSKERPRPSNTRSTSRFWRGKDDVIYIITWSDGTSGQVWARNLLHSGHPVMPDAAQLLRSKNFHPTSDMVRMVAILKGKHVRGRHTIPDIRRAFRTHSLETPHPEIACLLRAQLTGQHLDAMGLSHIVVAHAPIVGHSHQLVLGEEKLYVCNTHDPVDLGQQAPGVAFVVWEHASPLSLAA